MYQQGDLILLETEKVKGKRLDHLILAYGEATGHHHRIATGQATLSEENGTLYLRVDSNKADLVHEEHGKITIPKGDYLVRRVREFDHFAEKARAVRD